MQSMDNEWGLRNALLLSTEENNNQQWSPLHKPRNRSNCEVYTTTHHFPAPDCKANDLGYIYSTVTKVKTTVHCSLQAFIAFITTPHNLQYHEDSILFNEIIERKKKKKDLEEDGEEKSNSNNITSSVKEAEEGVLMHTVYRHNPPLDVFTLHQYRCYPIPQALDSNELLKSFLKSNVNGVRNDNSNSNNKTSSHTKRRVNRNSNSPCFLPSEVFVYSIHSIQEEENGGKNTSSKEMGIRSSFPSGNIHGWMYLSAFIAYEMPGPCMHLTFINAPDEYISATMGKCEEKISRIRNLCEMLQEMMSGGKLALLQHQEQEEKEEQEKEKERDFQSCRTTPETLQGHSPMSLVPTSPTESQLRVLRPLLKLNSGGSWRYVMRQEGCEVEECEARDCIDAPPSLKAFRISTSISCSLVTFFNLVGDPSQLHRYDAFIEESNIIDTRKGEEVVIHGRYKRLASNASSQDYCVIFTSALLQPEQEQELRELLNVNNFTAMIYLQNSIHSNMRPLCEGYERQIVYAFGYFATTEEEDHCIHVNHIVCVDTLDNMNRELETKMIQAHITRMSWIRQLCEDARQKTVFSKLSLNNSSGNDYSYGEEDKNDNDRGRKVGMTKTKKKRGGDDEDDEDDDNNYDGEMSFTELITLEDIASLSHTPQESFIMYPQSPAPLDESFEELEGIFDEEDVMNDAGGVPFGRTSPVRKLQISGLEAGGGSPLSTTTLCTSPLSWPHTIEEEEEKKKKERKKEKEQQQPYPQHQQMKKKKKTEEKRGDFFRQSKVALCRNPPPPVVSQSPPDAAIHSRDFLQIDIHSCRNLLTNQTAKRCVFFFLLRTSAARAQTTWIAFKENPLFHYERILFEGPQGNILTITAVVRTTTGRLKRLGKAVISLRNIRESEPRTRWIALVRNAGKENAYVAGEVCLTVHSGGVNARASPAVRLSEEGEEALRKRIYNVLVKSGRRDLHRLEWLVSRYWDLPEHEVDRLLSVYTREEDRKKVTITILDVQGVLLSTTTTTDVGLPLLNNAACQVWVETNHMSYCSKTVRLQQIAVFKESFQLSAHVMEIIRITVFIGGVNVGKVLISVNPEHFGGIRVHTIFHAAGTRHASPSGYITLGLYGEKNETTTTTTTKRHQQEERQSGGSGISYGRLEEETRISRLRLLLWNYAREMIHKLDVIHSLGHSLDYYTKKLGPSPLQYDLYVSLKRWESSAPDWDSPSITTLIEKEKEVAVLLLEGDEAEEEEEKGKENQMIHYKVFPKRYMIYCIIHVGLYYYKSQTIYVNDMNTVEMNESFVFHNVLLQDENEGGENDEVVISVVGKGINKNKDVDLGLTVLSLRTLQQSGAEGKGGGGKLLLTVPLIRSAGTYNAHIKGSIKVELFLLDVDERKERNTITINQQQRNNNDLSRRLQIQRLLYRYDPKQLHRVECLLAKYTGREEELLRMLLKQCKSHVCSTSSSSMEIRLIGLHNFLPLSYSSAFYIKIYLNGKVILRSFHQYPSEAINVSFSSSDTKNICNVMLDDPQHCKLRFKITQYRYLHSVTLCFAEMRLWNMMAGVMNEYWLPLFSNNSSNNNGDMYEEIGRLGVVLQSNGFVCSDVNMERWDDVEREVISLLKKYKPESLPFLQPLMAEVSTTSKMHTEIRARVATRPIALTVYISLESLSLTNPDVMQPYNMPQRHQGGEKIEYMITASCDHEDGSIIWSEQLPQSASIIRLDIPEFSKRGDHRLIISVSQVRSSRRSLSRSGKKKRSTSRGSRTGSPRETSTNGQLPPMELCRVVVSLRALLTHGLYDMNERISLPLVSFTQSPAARRTLQQQCILQQQQQQGRDQQRRSMSPTSRGRLSSYCSSSYFPCCSIVGTVGFSIHLPSFEHIPSWLQLDTSKMEKHSPLNRKYIRHYEKRIRDILTEHEPQSLLDLHYILYERDVAGGMWHASLRDWKRVLLQRHNVVQEEGHESSPPQPLKRGKSQKSGVRQDVVLEEKKEKSGKVNDTHRPPSPKRVSRNLFLHDEFAGVE